MTTRPGRRSVFRVAVVVAVLLMISPGGVQSQSPETRSPLVASTCGWDMPDGAPLPRVLGLVEERLGDEGLGSYETQTARDGLTQLEQWVRQCDAGAARQAVLELRRAWQRRPSSPVVEAALGISLGRGIEIQPPRARGRSFRVAYQFSNAEREARRLLAQALEEWPVPELGEELAALGLATRNETTLEMAAGALRALTGQLPETAGVWTTRAEVALARGEYDEAIEAGGKAAELRDPSGFRALGIARLLCDQDPAEGGRMYLEGLAQADTGAVYRYHEDVSPLLLEDEEKEWAGVTGLDEQRAWLRRKWEWRASTAGRMVTERLALHFQRLQAVLEKYPRNALRGARPLDALVWDTLYLRFPYDDRGLLYVRHGEPDDIIYAAGSRRGAGKEAWVYRQLNGGRGVFFLEKPPDWTDYLLSPPPICDPLTAIYGSNGAAAENQLMNQTYQDPGRPGVISLGWHTDFEYSLNYMERLSLYQPELAMAALRCRMAVYNPHPDFKQEFADTSHGQDQYRRQRADMDALPPPEILDELRWIRLEEASLRADARRALSEALHTETAVPRFEAAIQALSSVYAFRDPDGRTDVAAFLLLPTGQLTPRPLEEGVVYPLRLSLAVEDPVAEGVQRLDTLLGFTAPQRLQPGLYLRTALQMEADPVLSATVRITVRNPDHPEEGQILVGTRTIPAFPATSLSMSDLVVGEMGTGTWHRGGVSISPVPGHQVAAAGKFRLFYELYGLRPDESIRTHITIAPSTDPTLLAKLKALPKQQEVLELSFDESAQPGPDGVLQVERTITPSLDPGRYTLEVTVERSNGESAKMETRILLLEGK